MWDRASLISSDMATDHFGPSHNFLGSQRPLSAGGEFTELNTGWLAGSHWQAHRYDSWFSTSVLLSCPCPSPLPVFLALWKWTGGGSIRLTSSFKKGRSQSRVAQLAGDMSQLEPRPTVTAMLTAEIGRLKGYRAVLGKPLCLGPAVARLSVLPGSTFSRILCLATVVPQPVLTPARPRYQPAQLWWQQSPILRTEEVCLALRSPVFHAPGCSGHARAGNV